MLYEGSERKILHSVAAFEGKYQKEMPCERSNWRRKIISDTALCKKDMDCGGEGWAG